MQRISFLWLMAIVLTLGLAQAACNNQGSDGSNATQQKTDQADKSGKEYTSAYVCPMHCEGSGGDAPGKCPACGMDYVQNDGGNKHDDHHGHDHSHDGHGH